jgi:hypothetical protein
MCVASANTFILLTHKMGVICGASLNGIESNDRIIIYQSYQFGSAYQAFWGSISQWSLLGRWRDAQPRLTSYLIRKTSSSVLSNTPCVFICSYKHAASHACCCFTMQKVLDLFDRLTALDCTFVFWVCHNSTNYTKFKPASSKGMSVATVCPIMLWTTFYWNVHSQVEGNKVHSHVEVNNFTC